MKTKTAKVAWLTSVGAGLEYYDFIIYGMMAIYLGPLFFPSDTSWGALLKTFGVFAVGYLARPFGGVCFGMIGDMYGRKSTFLAVMILMAASTFSIGLLPTYGYWGVGSTLALVVLRIIQGFSFGAELPGAITVICEYSQTSRQGSYTGYVVSSMGLGSIVASLVLYLLTTYTTQSQIMEWAWRIPFLLGGVLAFASYFIRKYLGETPEFSRSLQMRKSSELKNPLVVLGKNYLKEIVLGIGMTCFHASLVLFYLYMPTYLIQHYSYASSDVYLALTCGMIWSSLSLPFAGIISDKLGKRNVFIGTSSAFILLGYALFKMLDFNNIGLLVGFLVLYQTVISFLVVSYLPLLSSLFTTQVRYTGIACCYNATYSLMGTLPLFMTYLIQLYSSPLVALPFLLSCACITILCALNLPKENANKYSTANL